MSAQVSIVVVLALLLTAGCASSAEPANVLPLDECIVEVWFHSPRDCRCTVAPLDTPECAEPDCRAADMILLRDDRRYFSSVLRWSEALRTLSAPGGRVILTADWHVELPNVLVLDRDTGVTTPQEVGCARAHLTLGGTRHYEPAPPDLGAAALGASRTDAWLSMPY